MSTKVDEYQRQLIADGYYDGRCPHCGRKDEPWVLCSERLPKHGERVEFVCKGKAYFMLALFREPGVFVTAHQFSVDEVLCWRHARPIGTLPQEKA